MLTCSCCDDGSHGSRAGRRRLFGMAAGANFPGVIGEMIQPIIPAVSAVRDDAGDMLDNAVRANARRVAARLKTQSPVIQAAVTAGKLKVVASHYALAEGHVTWMEDA